MSVKNVASWIMNSKTCADDSEDEEETFDWYDPTGEFGF